MSNPTKLNQAIQNYWHSRAKGYSLSTLEELQSCDNPYRKILKKWLSGDHSAQSALDWMWSGIPCN